MSSLKMKLLAAGKEHGDFTTDRRMLLLAAMAVPVALMGLVSAWFLIKLIALCTNLFYFGDLSFVARPFANSPLHAARFIVPAAGGLVIGLMARFGSEKILGHGIPEAIEAILVGKSRIQPKLAFLKPLSSAISIGSGGPFGAEGPIIMTGGALGSLLAQFFHLTASERKTLLVAGAAAGMTAIFNTPVAAILLATEFLLFEWRPRSLIPVIASVVVVSIFRPLLFTSGPMFPAHEILPLTWRLIPGLCVVGLASGLVSGALTLTLYKVEDLFRRLPVHWMWWPVLGGFIVGFGGLLDPRVLGVGYDNIGALLEGHMSVHDAASLLFLKAAVWLIALGSCTSGGVLAPLLMIGGAVGELCGIILPSGHPGFWALLGMTGIVAGTMRTPLTATLFAAELTGNFDSLAPLIGVSGVAYGLTVLLMKRSILTEKLARRGYHVTREYALDVFHLMRVRDVMAKQVDTVPAAMTTTEAVAFFTGSNNHHRSYPVVDESGKLIGMVSRADILRLIGGDAEPGMTLGALVAGQEIVTSGPDELLSELVDHMVATDTGRVPIVDAKDGRLVGIVSRKDVLKVRNMLAEHEKRRERHFFNGKRAASS